MEVGPPAACAPERGIEITQPPKRAPPADVPASASDAPVPSTPAPAPPNAVLAHARVAQARKGLSQLRPHHAPRLSSARFTITRGHPPANSPLRPWIPNVDPPPPNADPPPPLRAKLSASTPAEGNDAAGPSGAVLCWFCISI